MDYTKETKKRFKIKETNNFVLKQDYKFYNKTKSFRFTSFFHRLISNLFLRLFLKLAYKVKVENKKILKQFKHTGLVTISNHINIFDIQMIAIFLFGLKRVNWLTLEKNFCLNVHSFIKTSGGIPIPLDKSLKPKFFKEINELLQDKQILHICPEGELIENYNGIRPFKDGAFRFAIENHVPLIPITIKIKKINKKNKIKYNYTLVVNNPLFNNDLTDIKKSTQVLKDKAHKTMLNTFLN